MTTTNKEATDQLRAAVGKLIKAKGRFHTEQNYAALVAAYDAVSALPAQEDAQAVAVFGGYIHSPIDPCTPVIKWLGEPMPGGTKFYTAPTVAATPSADNRAVDALKSIRDLAFFDSYDPNGGNYYRKAENALAAIECRDAVEMPAATPSVQGESIDTPEFRELVQNVRHGLMAQTWPPLTAHIEAWHRARLARTAAPSDPTAYTDEMVRDANRAADEDRAATEQQNTPAFMAQETINTLRDENQELRRNSERQAEIIEALRDEANGEAAPSEGLAIPGADVATLLGKALVDLRNNCKDEFLVKMVSAPIQRVIALTRAAALAAEAPTDVQARQNVAAALGIDEPRSGANFAWSYLLRLIQEAAKDVERDNKIATIIAEIRAAKSMAWRDSLFENLIEVFEGAAPATEQAKPALAPERLAELIAQAQKIPQTLSTVAPIPLTPVQIAFIVGKAAQPVPQAPGEDRIAALCDLQYDAGARAGFMAGERGDTSFIATLDQRVAGAVGALKAAVTAPQASGELDVLEMELALYRGLYGPEAPSDATIDVLAERKRQVENEGYDHEHDDAHPNGEIAAYAAFYAMPPAARDWPATETGYGDTFGEAIVPADWTVPKEGDRRRELVKAGALVLAEIERLDRAATTSKPEGEAA